ncbi:hypothetical protein LC607_09835 [Nostoc sp. CHAB 5824]|nr:hypothetical protein [Nostoc sp. CHAB 5824]
MKTKSGGDRQIYLASKNPVFGVRQQIDRAISFAKGYLSLRASIAIAFTLKAQSVR